MSKRGGWAFKADQPPQPKLGFQKKNGQVGVEPANIATADLMIATRRAMTGLNGNGLPRDAFLRSVAVELGYQRTPKPVAKAIDNGLRAASQRGIIYTEHGRVYGDTRHIGHYERDELKRALLRVVGHTWITRDEAVTLATRHLGFERTGKKIKAAFKSALTGLLRQDELEKDGEGNVRRA
ncbi:MAG: hypothetical protein WD534_10015 [Phycisphaeraceae bacterium]